MDRSIAALIITYNRKELLVRCLSAVKAQQRCPDRIIILDNACTDGTRDYLVSQGIFDDPNIDYVRLRENEGASGGFYWGFRYAYEQGADWIWVMDDDVEPTPSTLSRLEDHCGLSNIGFLCSTVAGRDGTTPMNVPVIDMSADRGMYPSWGVRLEDGLVRVIRATFVSNLISRQAIARCGFPNRRFYIWGDDYEYTERIRRAGFDGFLVGRSKVLHKRAEMGQLAVLTEPDPKRIKMLRYQYRNVTWVSLRDNRRFPVMRALKMLLMQSLQILLRAPDRRLKRLSVLIYGTCQGFFAHLENRNDWELADVIAEIRPSRCVQENIDAKRSGPARTPLCPLLGDPS